MHKYGNYLTNPKINRKYFIQSVARIEKHITFTPDLKTTP